MLAPLDNETIFKQAFTDKTVFKSFVKDIIGINIEVNKIETEKRFAPKVGNIDFAYDIFAESKDHRVVVEIQRVDYDYNLDRFLHYHIMAIAELQRRAKDYRIEQMVFTIVVLTAPYRIDEKTHLPIKDEVMISSMDPRNLQDKEVRIYGHKMIFLNHHYRNNNTPSNYRDWLDLFYESIHHPDDYKVNLSNEGIKKAVELIEYDKLSPEARHLMKIAEQRKIVRKMDNDDARKEGVKEGLKKGLEKGMKKGIKEGLEKGRKEENIKMAKLMKKNGESTAKIIKYTGLSEEIIKEL
jgi:predicted transposase/invertase (TIGR01784 family)